MKITDIISPPTIYKDRLKKTQQLRPIIRKVYKNDENNYMIECMCNEYTVQFQFIGSEFNLTNRLKVYCSCPNFNFEFAHILNDNDGLLFPHLFKKAISKTPKQKNKYNVLFACKHCVSCGQLIYKKFDLLQRQFN